MPLDLCNTENAANVDAEVTIANLGVKSSRVDSIASPRS